MSQSLHSGDLHVQGRVTAQSMTPPAGCVVDASVAAGANVAQTKLQHRHALVISQTGTIAAGTYYLHILQAAGSFLSFEAAVVETAAGGDRTVTIDVKRSTAGGAFASVLTATLVLDSGNTIRVPESGTFSSTTLADGDVIQVTVAIGGSSGTQPAGLVVRVAIAEDAL